MLTSKLLLLLLLLLPCYPSRACWQRYIQHALCCAAPGHSSFRQTGSCKCHRRASHSKLLLQVSACWASNSSSGQSKLLHLLLHRGASGDMLATAVAADVVLRAAIAAAVAAVGCCCARLCCSASGAAAF
jgi:hypothetical protein